MNTARARKGAACRPVCRIPSVDPRADGRGENICEYSIYK